MNDIISKITSYDFFNNLLPWIIFAYTVDNFTNYSLIQDNLLVGAFLYYFIWIIISRFGSLFVEPILKFVKFADWIDYKKFKEAATKDSKIYILSEKNNMYRTFISMFILILLIIIYEYLKNYFNILNNYNWIIIIFILLILFLFSYKKQTKYIVERVKITK